MKTYNFTFDFPVKSKASDPSGITAEEIAEGMRAELRRLSERGDVINTVKEDNE